MSEIQTQIIAELGTKPSVDPKLEIRRRIDFIKNMIAGSRQKGIVLGISGGQDSTLVGKLCQLAVDELNNEGYAAVFVAVRLPYGEQRDEVDAQMALDFIQPTERVTFNIKDTVDAFAATWNANAAQPSLSDYAKGNVKARVRMITQYAYASERGLLVSSTDHSAENLVGYFTKFGDGGADIVPLDGLNKRQGKLLLRELGAPQRLYEKAPTADLLDGVPGQEDETELGVSYNTIDDFLEGKDIDPIEEKMLVDRYFATAHKRHLPVTPSDITE